MKRWSPELISGRLRKEGIELISAKSIYKWIFNEKSYLIPYLRRHNKDRVYKKSKNVLALPPTRKYNKDRVYIKK